MKATFLNEECNITFHQYSNGRIAIQLAVAETGEPMAIATINLPDERLLSDEVIIKDYSENTGMVDSLLAAGVINHPHRYVSSGWVEKIPVCDLTPKAKEAIK